LGNPTADPHDDPIPAADGSIEEPELIALSNVAPGRTIELRRVDEGQADRLRYIASIGLTPGAVVSVIERQPFQGPITIEVDGQTHVIGHELGQVLFCAAEDEN
jgi:DtxR family Mn-dependent transcriptional regulator